MFIVLQGECQRRADTARTALAKDLLWAFIFPGAESKRNSFNERSNCLNLFRHLAAQACGHMTVHQSFESYNARLCRQVLQMPSSPPSSMDDTQRSSTFFSSSSKTSLSDEKTQSVNDTIDEAIEVSTLVCTDADHC